MRVDSAETALQHAYLELLQDFEHLILKQLAKQPFPIFAEELLQPLRIFAARNPTRSPKVDYAVHITLQWYSLQGVGMSNMQESIPSTSQRLTKARSENPPSSIVRVIGGIELQLSPTSA